MRTWEGGVGPSGPAPWGGQCLLMGGLPTQGKHALFPDQSGQRSWTNGDGLCAEALWVVSGTICEELRAGNPQGSTELVQLCDQS